jgi:hypothetical protein
MTDELHPFPDAPGAPSNVTPTWMSLPTPRPHGNPYDTDPDTHPDATWDGKPKKIGFVDPATYQISRDESRPT